MTNTPVYVLMDVEIKDRVKFFEYVEGHLPSFRQYGGKLLFRSNDMTVIEGNWSPKLFVVHEWPSEESFRQWEESKEYAPWKKLRHEAMEVNMVLARKMPI
jgi:uncharacterized protein (DUF1330 family)